MQRMPALRQLLLKLRRQLQRRKVLKGDVIGEREASAHGRLVVTEQIPGEPNPRSEIIDVLPGHAEEERRQARIGWILQVGHGVDGLFGVIAWIGDEFISQAKV